MNALHLRRGGTFYLVTSEYEIPGELPPPALTKRFRCSDRRIRLRMVRGSATGSAERICEIAHESLQYIVNTFNSDGISLELDIAPPGHRLLHRSSAFGIKPKLTLGIASFEDPDLTLSNIAAVVAHESFHALLAKLGPNANAADEYSAHYFGMCGQLTATGKILKDRIPKSSVSGDDFAANSAAAGATVRREIIHLFQGDSLPAGSNGADLILEQCHRLATAPGRAAPTELTP